MNKQRPFIHKIMTKQQAIKLFEEKKIRTVWDDEQCSKWHFIEIESKEKSKEELKDESNEYSTK